MRGREQSPYSEGHEQCIPTSVSTKLSLTVVCNFHDCSQIACLRSSAFLWTLLQIPCPYLFLRISMCAGLNDMRARRGTVWQETRRTHRRNPIWILMGNLLGICQHRIPFHKPNCHQGKNAFFETNIAMLAGVGCWP